MNPQVLVEPSDTAEPAVLGEETIEIEVTPPAGPTPPRRAPGPRVQFARGALLTLFALCAAWMLQLAVVSRLQHDTAQDRLHGEFRAAMAEGTIAVGPYATWPDDTSRLLAGGEPVALLEIPAIGVSEVVVEGTASGDLFVGPGHRRDTPLPGQYGVSLIYGRRAAYGGPFAEIGRLAAGDRITVTTGQGVFEYVVRGARHAGDPVPPPLEAGGARLTLATATGWPFLPEDVVRVDADLDGTPVVGVARPFTPATLPADQQLMASDWSTLWTLVLWLQALIVLSSAAVWAWHRWGRPHAWIVFLPGLVLVALGAAGEAARLLPNLT